MILGNGSLPQVPELLECFGDRYINLQKSGRPTPETLTRFFVRKSKVRSIEVRTEVVAYKPIYLKPPLEQIWN